MRRRFDLAERPVELQKDLLRDLLGPAAVVQEVPGDAEDHVLMLADQSSERLVIAGRGALKRRIRGGEQEWCGRAHLRLYTGKSARRMQMRTTFASCRAGGTHARSPLCHHFRHFPS